MSKLRAIYSGLQYIPTFFTDTSLTSEDVFKITEFPLRLTAGKNLFKLQGNASNLKLGSNIECEVLDANGNAIYSEILSYIDEDKSRVIAIYIYEDTPPGPSTVTLIGEISTINNINVPAEWRNKINVKWSRQLPTNPTTPNESEIIFVNEPNVTVSENIGVQLDRSYTNTQFPTYSTGTVEYLYNQNYPVLKITGGKFTGEMLGGTITIPTPLSLQPTPTYNVTNTTYTSKIRKILSDTAIQLETPYTVNSNQSISSHTYNAFTATTYTASYESIPTYVSTQHSESFALVQIDKLEPSAGDISRIKVYTNTKGNVGTWEIVNDVALEGTEIFVDSTASLTPDESIGIFTTQSVIDTYWEGHTYLGNSETTAPTLTWTTSSINNGMLIDSSTDITSNNNVLVTQVKDQYTGYFISQSEYKVTLDALATRSTVSNNKNPKLFIYASGSAFNYNASDILNQDLPIKLGKKIGEIECTADNQRYDDIEFEFKADKTGNGSLLFVIDSGAWQIADVRTLTNAEIGYSPNYTRIRSEIPTKHKSDNQLSFKVEYYNIVGNRSKTVSYIYDKNWQGGNRYIDGGFSMLTGSLYVADNLRSGIDISGLKNTGFIRSLGYEGFNQATGSNGGGGFLLFSGSALPEQSATPYTGVGLEMVATSESYFKFRTDPSELEIVTDKFFLGKSGSVFISGSNGNLAISASNFSVSQDGAVNANRMRLNEYLIADLVMYRIIKIDGTADKALYYENYTTTINDSSGTPQTLNFTKLLLDGSQGGEIATQVRINTAPDYPIGMIITPDEVGIDEGDAIQLEVVATVYIALKSAESNNLFTDAFGADKDDWHYQLYQTRTIGSDTYGKRLPAGSIGNGTTNHDNQGGLWKLQSGCRIQFLKSTSDYRPIGISSFDWGSDTNGKINFDRGLATSNGGIYIGGGYGGVINSAAALQVDSTSQGFLPPRMTSTQRDAISSPPEGLIVYNTNAIKLQCYNGSGWQNLF